MMNVDDYFWKTVLDNLYDGVYFVDQDRRISYWNKGAERITGYLRDDVVGKPCWDNVMVHMCSGSMLPRRGNPIEEVQESSLYQEEEVSLLHREGHRIPVMTRTAVIRDLRSAITGAVVLFSDNQAMVEARQRIDHLEQMSLLDPLTRLGNRRYAEMQLQRTLDEFRRYGWSFGIIIISADGFETPSEADGRETADRALRTMAKTLSGKIRASDVLSRWTHNHLIAILLHVTHPHLTAIATKLQLLAAGSTLRTDQGTVPLTVSLGASLACTDDTVASLTQRAEAMLSESRAAGGNCVTVAPDTHAP
jgi:diguanylate cyclase (GGDEF)-like protein/PAS domain S-box-containing protein